RKVQDLSGGIRRRVQVAKMFMIDVPIIFLDEFSSGMDAILKRSVMAMLRAEAAAGRTIVLTTQILSEAEELCDDILIINNHRREPRRCVRSAHTTARGAAMMTHALAAVLVREAKIRATNSLFIFWDLVYPLGYLLVFGIGVNASLGFTSGLAGVEYNAFFLAGVLGMASFGIASNTSWSFFLDRYNGIFYEMLTYPMRRWEHLLGKVLFNTLVALVQALLTLVLATALLHVP